MTMTNSYFGVLSNIVLHTSSAMMLYIYIASYIPQHEVVNIRGKGDKDILKHFG